MNPRTLSLGQRRARGVAVIEFSILMPVLVFLTLPLIDVARAIQASLILTNLTREGASLASRATNYTPQAIMDAVGSTAPPLNLSRDGMLYITKIVGTKSGNGAGASVDNLVIEQYRWDNGRSGLPGSKVWGCGTGGTSWGGDGTCNNVASASSSSRKTTLMQGKLADGEVIYAVEAIYSFKMFFEGMSMGRMSIPTLTPNMYSITIF